MLNFTRIHCDAAERWQIGIQDPATPIAQGMLFFHNYLMVYITFIGVFVLYMLYSAYRSNSKVSSKFSHSNFLEIIWTIIPAITLIFIAVPSFTLLYSLDELSDPGVTLKIIGHQWYWSYEYSDYVFSRKKFCSTLNFDSYMAKRESEGYLLKGNLRLLDVDNRVVLPTHTHIRLLITSSDVLHSWAIPSFGIKVDATPGRLSQASLFIKREGTYYGQCSEICGVNHGFMPIVVKGMKPDVWGLWIQLNVN
jgi:cytochrome c oxidase subunit 2